MTDSSAPISDDDISADLDDEAGIDVRSRILADPTATARRADLEGASRLLAEAKAPQLPADQVDELVTRALDVLEAPDAPAAPSRAPRMPGPWLVAAAVVALVAIGLTLVWTGRQDTTDTAGSATSTESSDEPGTEAAAPAEGGDAMARDVATPETSQGATPELAPSGASYLGTYTDAAALREALSTSLNTGASQADAPESPSAAALTRCGEQLQITLELDGDPLATGFAVVDGRTVLVYEWTHESFTDGRPTTLVTAVGADACDQVALFER